MTPVLEHLSLPSSVSPFAVAAFPPRTSPSPPLHSSHSALHTCLLSTACFKPSRSAGFASMVTEVAKGERSRDDGGSSGGSQGEGEGEEGRKGRRTVRRGDGRGIKPI
jgi:hypothetical protein